MELNEDRESLNTDPRDQALNQESVNSEPEGQISNPGVKGSNLKARHILPIARECLSVIFELQEIGIRELKSRYISYSEIVNKLRDSEKLTSASLKEIVENFTNSMLGKLRVIITTYFEVDGMERIICMKQGFEELVKESNYKPPFAGAPDLKYISRKIMISAAEDLKKVCDSLTTVFIKNKGSFWASVCRSCLLSMFRVT
jgi:hypothetical protein